MRKIEKEGEKKGRKYESGKERITIDMKKTEEANEE